MGFGAVLLTELQTDPQGLGYAPLVASRDDEGLADLLNAERGMRAQARLCNERTILTYYSGGPLAADALLTKLETYAAASGPLSSITARAMRYVKQPDGLDLGSAVTATMLGALAQFGVITSDEMTKLTAIAHVPSSRAFDLFESAINSHDVTVALNSLTGV